MATGKNGKKIVKETFPEYLDRVGTDYQDSGSEYTSQDYFDAADRIRDLERTVSQLQAKLKTVLKAVQS